MGNRDQLYNDPEEAQRIALTGWQSGMWTALPGIIVDVDLTAMTCSVQPAIQGAVTDENGKVQAVNYPVLIHVPIIFPQGGGFAFTLPLAAGDEVLIVWASRCIDAWWQSGGIQRPIESRMHDMSDGFAIPGPVSQPNVLPSISSTAAQLRTKDGTAYIELTPAGGINVVAPGGFTVNGDVQVTGALNASGVVSGSDVTAGLIHLSTHKHNGVTTGTGTSGGPVP